MVRRLLLVILLCASLDAPAAAAAPTPPPSPTAAGAARSHAAKPVRARTVRCSAAATRRARAHGLACTCRMVRAGRRQVKRCRSAKVKARTTPARKAAPAPPEPAASTRPSTTSQPNPPAPIGPCANADVQPAQATVDAVRAAIVCLVNQERAKQGLGALTVSGQIQSAADRFSLRMVVERFFDHVAPDGSDLLSRLTGSGYVAPGSAYELGENIGYGTGDLGTPSSMVQAWMNSPGHRANILTADYRETGVGVALGVPTGSAAGATYTQDFGTR